jgi:formamidopyrimidine-DNA glycosylase
MRALAERLDPVLAGRSITAVTPIGISGLRTARPSYSDLIGLTVISVTSRAKYLIIDCTPLRVLVHLGQAGRLDIETPPRTTRPRGAVMRLSLGDVAIVVREYGTERRAGWWVLEASDEGPLATLGPEPGEAAFAEYVRTSDDTRHLHTSLRDQHVVAGIGRGYVDDILHTAKLSPFASLHSLDAAARERLLDAIDARLDEALVSERRRTGGLSEAKLGDRFTIHNRHGTPCPRCGTTLLRVSYASYEITYCPTCQTAGRVLADRRLSRLLR